MAKQVRNELTWQELNPETLQPEAATAYKAYKAKYAEAKALKDKFEGTMRRIAELPVTHTLRFGYNFGKLSCAVDTADGPRVSSKAVDFAVLVKGGVSRMEIVA